MQVVVRELLTNYSITGTGKNVLLLHGWGDNLKGMTGLQTDLSHKYRLIALDLPGFGGSSSPHKAWGLDDYAKFVGDFLKKINVDNLYTIVAHSNGGAISIRAVGNKILQPERLVLIASSGIRDTYKGRVKVIRLITKAGKVITMPLPKVTRDKLKRLVYKTVGSDMLVAEKLQESFKKIVTDDVQSDAKNISIPTLLIYGEKDTAAPVVYGRAFHELMDSSTLEIIGGAGHFVYNEKPEIVTRLIQDFLK